MEEVLQNVTQVQAKKINQFKEGKLKSREMNFPVLPFGSLSNNGMPLASHRSQQSLQQPHFHRQSVNPSWHPHQIPAPHPLPSQPMAPTIPTLDPSSLQGMTVNDLMTYATQSVASIQRLQQQVEEVAVVGEHRALQGVQALQQLAQSVSELRREMAFRSQQPERTVQVVSESLRHPDAKGSGISSLRGRPGITRGKGSKAYDSLSLSLFMFVFMWRSFLSYLIRPIVSHTCFSRRRRDFRMDLRGVGGLDSEQTESRSRRFHS